MVSGGLALPYIAEHQLGLSGLRHDVGLGCCCRYFCARLTEVSPLLRPSFSMAGPSGEVNASCTCSGLTTARSADSFQPRLPSSLR